MRSTTPRGKMNDRAATLGLCAAAVMGVIWLAGAGSESAVSQASPAQVTSAAQPSAIRYGRDVRPLLSDRCFKCHGGDEQSRMADLRLDVRESAVGAREGGPAIVPGHPEQSELLRRVCSSDPNLRMPPPDSTQKPLNEAEQDIIRRWIEQGAPYEPHWSFVPAKRPTPPALADTTWCRNAIDRFVLQRLQEEGLAPSPEAEPATLLRRIFLDLTGLPPTPGEIDAFLADRRPDAYERWIDKLLTEEPYRTRYAERMAVPWMDQARYADTSGIHMDAGRQMWLWRDWVIKAYRDNMPFDQFVTEQIAGDLLPDATDEQKIASGFNRNHVTSDEGGAIDEEYLVEYAVDRTATTGSVLLGLTVGCARCHEHKFDPISQEDFFRLFAYFNSNEEPGIYSQLPDANRAMEPFLVIQTPQQKQELTELRHKLETVKTELDKRSQQEDAQRANFTAEVVQKSAVAWQPAQITASESSGGATLTLQADGSVLASGKNPDKDDHRFTLRTQGRDLRLLLLEALADPSLGAGRVGRAPNGNAVLSNITAEAVSVTDPDRKTPIKFMWAWANVEQDNGNFRIINVLEPGKPDSGWAVDAHRQPGARVALFLAEEPFGYEGGTDLHVQLGYHSVYGQHALGRVRLSVAQMGEAGADVLPAASGGWWLVGPFPNDSKEAAYKAKFGPEESLTKLDEARNFGFGNQFWRFSAELRDEQVNPLGEGTNTVTYVGRRLLCPSPRKIELSLGSDDGFALFVNGKQVAAREIDRAVAPDQEKVEIELAAGSNTVVMKVINSAGPSGFYHRSAAREGEVANELVASLLPPSAIDEELDKRAYLAWKIAHSPGYRERKQRMTTLEQRIATIEAQSPRTMVMKELPKPRETFVLTRGLYDQPDKSRPVRRGVPPALGKVPDGAPDDRRGLAQWLVSAENPLMARVIVNRYWEMLFGIGLVRTSEDFGAQGEWPSHPELIDYLAVEFRESGWNVQHMLKLMLTSSTYRQSSRARPELRDRDPDNRLLAFFPRRRIAAEFLRDQALYMAGLLVEKLGGPSVKPYQPDGLWREVAMVQSNTRIYARGEGDDLWRRSLYTYWKRACPPPAMTTFDAPTRESCTINRPTTNTPLQALVLWNDEQFVEAARVLAQRTLAVDGDDRHRLVHMFRQCTGRTPEDAELERLTETLAAYRERYQKTPQDAAELLKVGVAPLPKDANAPEIAAWAMMANAMLNLSATITQY